MQKITLILGPAESGKTRKAYEMTSHLHKTEIVFMWAKNLNKQNYFRFAPCSENTKALVVDDLESLENLYEFYPMISGFQVDAPMKKPFIINPKIIITSSAVTADMLPVDASFTNRFDVINLAK